MHYRYLGFIAGFQFVPFKNRLLSLVYFANGAVTYYLTSTLHELFLFIYKNVSKTLRRVHIRSTHLMLFQIKRLSFVSCLETGVGRGAQYSRSPGTAARIIKFDAAAHTALLQLPSGIKKTFSYFSFAVLGKLTNAEHARYCNTKSGYWRNFGIKSTVRGVAMNPVDHPHGGRTKTIKYPRTP
jgi:large subunit ribosomal protein L2